MHLKVTVEEGRKAELKQQSLDAHYSLLWVFLREDTLLMWSKEESLLKGIHLNKAEHGMSSGRSSKVRETISWLAACLEHKWRYFPLYQGKRRSRAELHFEAAVFTDVSELRLSRRIGVSVFFLAGRGFYASDS